MARDGENGLRTHLQNYGPSATPALIRRGDGLGPVDFDVATNSLGMEVKSFTVKIRSQDASHASVADRLAPNNWVRKSERENEIRYDLV